MRPPELRHAVRAKFGRLGDAEVLTYRRFVFPMRAAGSGLTGDLPAVEPASRVRVG